MPVFGLQIKASLENVEKLYADPTMYWGIKFQCLSCNQVSENAMEFSSEDQNTVGRSTVNLVSRCHFCSRTRTVEILPYKGKIYTNEDLLKFKTIATFDCRGMEPVEFIPGNGWIVEAMCSGVKFEDVDLKEKEWVEYDIKEEQPVGIYSLEYQFVKE